MSKREKPSRRKRTVYREDTGETLYSMAALDGMTPEEQEELYEKKKNRIPTTGRERWAMIRAEFAVYGPLLLICVGAFSAAALLMYLFLLR